MSRPFIRRTVFVLTVLAVTSALFIGATSSTPLPSREAMAHASAEALVKYRNDEISFPGQTWARADPATLGWSTEALESARRWAEDLDTGAVFVVHRGLVVADWGATDERLVTQSIRKSLLSSLFGRLVASGQLDLDATLADLDIDDRPPLSLEERQATVRDLLLSRSGIYRSAIYEAPGWRRRKPEPGSHRPGEYWFYNNWSFNALGTIFSRVSGQEIGAAFLEWIAKPIGMEDFRARDVSYLTSDHLTERLMGNASDHPAYMFHLSSRDLARFGLLYASGGAWAGRQVVDRAWIEEEYVWLAGADGLGRQDIQLYVVGRAAGRDIRLSDPGRARRPRASDGDRPRARPDRRASRAGQERRSRRPALPALRVAPERHRRRDRRASGPSRRPHIRSAGRDHSRSVRYAAGVLPVAFLKAS